MTSRSCVKIVPEMIVGKVSHSCVEIVPEVIVGEVNHPCTEIVPEIIGIHFYFIPVAICAQLEIMTEFYFFLVFMLPFFLVLGQYSDSDAISSSCSLSTLIHYTHAGF